MRSLDLRRRLLAASLAALAGYVDAVGFIGSGGFFMSFMSGNSTRFGVGLIEWEKAALYAAGLMAAFVAGVAGAALLKRPPFGRPAPRLMLLVAVLLALGAILVGAGAGPLAFLPVAAAMGAENTLFEENGDVPFGLTYMTGTLVKLGLALANAARGVDRMGWAPFALHWAMLVGGAVAGAAAWPRLGLDALWLAAGLAALMALIVRQVFRAAG
jgi:uncharacterized membrane protein YoaK (UPF0700 family)